MNDDWDFGTIVLCILEYIIIAILIILILT